MPFGRPLALLLGGLLLILLGIMWASLQGASVYLSRLLLVLGAALVMLALIQSLPAIRFFFLRAQTFSEPGPTWTLLLLALALLLAAALAARYPLRVDTTAQRFNSLRERSQTVLGSLDEDVFLEGYFEENSPAWEQAGALLERFEESSRRVHTSMIDIDREPERAEEARIRESGVMRVVYRDGIEIVRGVDEQGIASALMRLMSGKRRVVAFTSGHGEPPLKGGGSEGVYAFAAALRDENFDVRSLELYALQDVPSDVDALLIVNPQTSLLAGEVAAISQFLDRGGRLALFLEPGFETGLEPLLESHLIELPAAKVRDESLPSINLGLGVWTPATIGNPRHPLTEKLTSFVVLSGARPVVVRSAGIPGYDIDVILKTGERGERVPLEEVASEGAARGSQPVGAAASWDVPLDAARDSLAGQALAAGAEDLRLRPVARVVVIGDADVVSNRYLSLLGNKRFCVGVAHWLTDQETYLRLGPPPVSFVPPKVGLRTLRSFFYMVTFGIPAVLVLAGFLVWLRRRGLGGI